MEKNSRKESKINLITPPDKLNNFHKTFFLLYPSNDMKSQFQNLIDKFEETINVYLYEPEEPELQWVLDVINYSHYTIIDIDNVPSNHRDLISFLLGHSNVFWLTKGENPVYNTLSKNRIYNLDWLYEYIGEKI